MCFTKVGPTVHTFNGMSRAERVVTVLAGRRMAKTMLHTTFTTFSAIVVTNHVTAL